MTAPTQDPKPPLSFKGMRYVLPLNGVEVVDYFRRVKDLYHFLAQHPVTSLSSVKPQERQKIASMLRLLAHQATSCAEHLESME